MTESDWAWAAGFFDGEGSTTSSKSNSANVRITITQYHPEVLEKFIHIVGYGKVYGPCLTQSGKQFWQVCLSTKPTIVTLGKMWPYLSSVKKNQAIRALNEYTKQLNGRSITTRKSVTMDGDEID